VANGASYPTLNACVQHITRNSMFISEVVYSMSHGAVLHPWRHHAKCGYEKRAIDP